MTDFAAREHGHALHVGAMSRAVLIDKRALERECFVRGVEAAQPSTRVDAFSTVAEWLERRDELLPADAILFNVDGRRFSDRTLADDVAALERAARPTAVIVLSPFDEVAEMVAALDCGARSYVATSLGITAALSAIPLATAGALCLPASSVLAIRNSIGSTPTGPAQSPFTTRQKAVAEALRRGKPNKLIAYELNMCESTVKVHIRTIMKKLHAKNRTEAGFKLNSLLPGLPDGPDRTPSGFPNGDIEPDVTGDATAPADVEKKVA